MLKQIVEVKDISKYFGTVAAVDHISFTVWPGEVLGLLGPNGAGKTTTIQLLLGLTTLTHGQIEILGMDIKTKRNEILQRVNFSSAYISLPSNLTVYENLVVFAKLYGIRHYRNKIMELLEFFDLLHILNSRTGMLSTGQMTRLNLTKSFINDPEIIFLDEPTASLDPEVASRVREKLKKIQIEKNVSMIYTSHNMNEVELMCNRVLFIANGKNVLEGTPKEIKEKSGSLEDVFISIARATNFQINNCKDERL
ncbi:MAG: ABC transporter ATP-binding protein [Desulfobacterales bacterium]|nr:ABC transporter ATP-binding protein [Desulfobacterales bacterium]